MWIGIVYSSNPNAIQKPCSSLFIYVKYIYRQKQIIYQDN